MGYFVEMATGVGDHDTSYGYIAFRPCLVLAHAQLLHSSFTCETEMRELNETTEYEVRSQWLTEVGSLGQAKHASAYLQHLGYLVHWVNKNTNVKVAGSDDLFTLLNSDEPASLEAHRLSA